MAPRSDELSRRPLSVACVADLGANGDALLASVEASVAAKPDDGAVGREEIGSGVDRFVVGPEVEAIVGS